MGEAAQNAVLAADQFNRRTRQPVGSRYLQRDDFIAASRRTPHFAQTTSAQQGIEPYSVSQLEAWCYGTRSIHGRRVRWRTRRAPTADGSEALRPYVAPAMVSGAASSAASSSTLRSSGSMVYTSSSWSSASAAASSATSGKGSV